MSKYNRRYYLHWKLRQQGYKLNTKKKTILVKMSGTKQTVKTIESLKSEYGYCEQFTL